MAVQHGRSGLIHIATVAAGHVTSWSYSETAEEVEITEMGDTAKSYQAGLRDGTFNFEGYWDPADAGLEDFDDAFAAGTAVTVTVYPTGVTTAGAPTISGSLTVNNKEINSGVDQMITVKFSGRGFMAEGVVS
jgi:hypothetical protein